jgi:malate dehydrogenase
MQTVAILGAGELGGTIARTLACRDLVTRIVLIDKAASVAAGKALDIRQSGPLERFETRLEGTDDLTAIMGAAIVVLADEHGAGEWTGDAALQLLGRVQEYSPRSVIIAAGASQRDVLRMAVTERDLAAVRLIGSAPVAATGAARALTAIEACASATDVSLSVIGAPPGWVVAWSEGSIAGSTIVQAMSPAAIGRVEARLRASWPPGAYALASAATAVVHAALTASHRRLSCFVADLEQPRRSRFIALPALLGPGGLQATHMPALGPRERVALDALLGA